MLNVNQQKTALQDINYLVVGLGVTGYSVARYLLGHGYRCRIQDTRELPPFLGKLNAEFDEIDFRAQPLDIDLIGWADALVVSPGISIRQDAIQQALDLGKVVLGDIELFARFGRQACYRDHRFQWQEHRYDPGRRNDKARR